jgi:hypothetical protein
MTRGGSMTITEYTGQLVGGPNEGNMVTSSVKEIPFADMIRLWLDGIDKEPTCVVTNGTYIWSDEDGCFNWKLTGSVVLR